MNKINIVRVLCRRTISPDLMLPLLVIPIHFLVAPYGFYTTICSSILSLLALYLQASYPSSKNHTAKIIHSWNVIYFILFQFIFAYNVIPSLQIMWEELLLSLSITCITIACFWMTKRLDKKNTNSLIHTYHYSLWLHCNIIETNIETYFLGLFTGIWNAMYQTNIIWKSICHPYTWIGNFVIPDDCSSAYTSYDLALLSIHSLYCVCVAITFTIFLILQIMSTNFENETKKAPRKSRKEKVNSSSII